MNPKKIIGIILIMVAACIFILGCYRIFGNSQAEREKIINKMKESYSYAHVEHIPEQQIESTVDMSLKAQKIFSVIYLLGSVGMAFGGIVLYRSGTKKMQFPANNSN